MSFHRENVIWESQNGRWNIGFFECYDTGSYDDEDYDDYDPEWDVEYNFDVFDWVSTGHSTEESARNAWQGANPGGSMICTYGPGTAQECRMYDEMAQRYKNKNRGAWR